MRFAVFTHVLHREQEGRYYAYAPYVREMNLWFRYVEEVEVVAPLEERRRRGEEETGGKGEEEKRGVGEEGSGGNGELYNHSRITFSEIPSFHLLNFPAALDSLIKIPVIFFRILAAMRRADHLHLRCPGNIGLLAAIAQIFFPGKPKTVKYAGNWDPESKQPWTYRLQKWILNNTFVSRNIKVLIYGKWPGQSKNIVPFFTASLSEKDREVVEKDFNPPYKFIYTGNLVQGKGIAETIQLIEVLLKKEVDCRLEIYGDGPFEKHLRNLVRKKGLSDFISFKGRVSLQELKSAYRRAQFSVLLSQSEGWPKVIAEGMWFGCIPVATDVSCVPWMLGEGSRGIVVDSTFKVQDSRFNVDWIDKTAGEVQEVIENREEMRRMSFAAQEWSQGYTLEGFEEAIRQLLNKGCG